MARYLITGMNTNQCTRKFYLRQQLKVIPSHYSLYNCLVDMGHEVDQRVVEFDDDLSMYDDVFVFIAGPRQLVATRVYNGLMAIAKRPDCILLMDDWQVPDLFKGVVKCQNPDELFAQFILDVNKKTIEDVQPYQPALLDAIKVITAKKNRMLVSAFQTGHLNDTTFGPHLLFNKIDYPNDRLFVYNPNPFHRNRKPGDLGHEGAEDSTWSDGGALPSAPRLKIGGASYVATPAKERRFNFASLVQSKTQKWLKKQGYRAGVDDESGSIGSWPVDLYGSKAETQKRLTEDAMCFIFQRDWACLMPGYEHAGSGWWRARPLQCANADCILIGDSKELAVYYGADFPYLDLRATDLIAATDMELRAIVNAQKEAIYKLHPLDKDTQKSELQAVLDAPKGTP